MDADERLRVGEEQGRWLAQLHALHFASMLRIAIRSLPPPCQANAEDVVQTVFVEATAAAARCPSTRIGEGWLVRRLTSRIADHHRRAARQQRLVVAIASAELIAAEAIRAADEIVVDRSAVEALLATVPDREDQRTLALKLSGMSEAEIADRMNPGQAGRPVRDRMRRVQKQARTASQPRPARLPGLPTSAAPPCGGREPACRT